MWCCCDAHSRRPPGHDAAGGREVNRTWRQRLRRLRFILGGLLAAG